MMHLSLDHLLFLLSAGLLWPVLAVLMLLTIGSVLLLGGLGQEFLARRSTARWLRPRLKVAKAATTLWPSQSEVIQTNMSGYVARYLRTLAENPSSLAADKQIDDIELEMAARLARLALIGRLGPMLGLAGTLIPLGPALLELARGNVAALAAQLVVAFSATIVGLLIGMIAITVGQIRRAWYAADLSDIAYLQELRAAARDTEPACA